MPTLVTLKKRADFVRLRRGRKIMSPYFILRVGAADVARVDTARVGYTVTTQCGNAVTRNRMKRRLRALVRELLPEKARAGQDYVFIALAEAKPNLAEAPFADIRSAFLRAVERL